MSVYEYVFDSSIYLFFVATVLVALNGFITSGVTFYNVLVLLLGSVGAGTSAHRLLMNPVNWYDEIL